MLNITTQLTVGFPPLMPQRGLHLPIADLQAIVPTTIVVLSYLQLTPGDTANQTATVHFASDPEHSTNFHSAGRRYSITGSSSHGEFTCELTETTRSASSLDIEKQLRLLDPSPCPSGGPVVSIETK